MDDSELRKEILTAAASHVVRLDDEDIAQLLAFLASLTDPVSLAGRLGVSNRVPSGLPLDQ